MLNRRLAAFLATPPQWHPFSTSLKAVVGRRGTDPSPGRRAAGQPPSTLGEARREAEPRHR
jgi:hypothetical protein